METAKFGALETVEGGMNRLSLNMDDKQVRDWFVARATELGCAVRVDAMGNIFATWSGPGNDRSDLPPIGMGSHLDTQPLGKLSLYLQLARVCALMSLYVLTMGV